MSAHKTSRRQQHQSSPVKSSAKQQSSNNGDGEVRELRRLLTLLQTPASKQQLPSIHIDQRTAKAFQWPVPQPKGGAHQHQSTEALELEKFGCRYGNQRVFHSHAHHDLFKQIFSALNKRRLCCAEWIEHCPTENILRVLVCLRIMLRDAAYQKLFYRNDGARTLAEYLHKATDSYLFYGDGHLVVEILKEMTNIVQKLASSPEQREWLMAYNVHRSLVLLLSASDVIVLHCSLHALTTLAESKSTRALISELNAIEHLLKILQDYDDSSKKVAASLLRVLCADSQSRELVKCYDGIPVLLSLLHSDNVKLLWHAVWCLVQLAEDPDTSNDIRHMGGIPLILSLLHDRAFLETPAQVSSAPPHGRPRHHSQQVPQPTSEQTDQILSLKAACCACLTELVRNDTNARQIVQANGIHVLALLILPDRGRDNKRETENLQRNAFRALRFLFSMERNRRLFQRLFPPSLYESFIDCGHYVRDLKTYKPLVEAINKMTKETLEEIRDNINGTDQNKTPSHFIGEYAVLELLGSGAFGCVYRVKKQTGASYLAMKEIQTAHIVGKKRDQAKSVGEIINELTIIKEQLRHPNIVRYYKTFVETDKLYIVMELIEGAPLGEHFQSLKEKGESFTEERIWRIFIQMVLALRYLHKEKHIIHRDLSPNNIMLGENDHVTITDFGLAKQKTADCSRMNSFVGTVLYSCPEIMQNLPYGEKADVWALGCVLYQMCTLRAPFYSNNLISLAKMIVDARYEPLPEGAYSDQMASTITRCLTPEPEQRSDVVQVAGHLADIMLRHLDLAQTHQLTLERKLERERKRTQRHYFDASQKCAEYHRLFLISQERQDKLAGLQSSGGAASIKNGELSDVSDTESVDSRRRGRDRRSQASNTDLSEEDLSSSNSSRVSSAGSVHSLELDGTLKADEQSKAGNEQMKAGNEQTRTKEEQKGKGKEERRKSRRKLSQELCVDIPNSAPLPLNRDSGLSSGDPSPNPSLPTSSPSSGELPGAEVGLGAPGAEVGPGSGVYRRQISDSSTSSTGSKRGGRLRPNSANPATLTISPRKVRQINDPILQMLHQLHKILYISQLPPTLCPNQRRRYIDRYKRALFAPQSTSFNLKSELKKLLMGSREPIDLDFGLESPFLSRQVSSESDVYMTSQKSGATSLLDIDRQTMDYEQMQSIIESVLVESGYYDVPVTSLSHAVTSPVISPNTRPRFPSER